MSFLSELKNQANALQQKNHSVQHDAAANLRSTELACQVTLRYLQDLCVQLNVIRPPAVGTYSLDGKRCSRRCCWWICAVTHAKKC